MDTCCHQLSSLYIEDNEQVLVEKRKELGHCGQKRSLVIVLWFLAFACLYVYVCLSLVRFSSIYGAFHSKQTSNAGGLCVHVVSQLVVRFKPREDVVRLACSSKVSQVSGIDWFPGHNDAWGICVHVVPQPVAHLKLRRHCGTYSSVRFPVSGIDWFPGHNDIWGLVFT